MIGIRVDKAFNSEAGTYIEPGEFIAGDVVSRQPGEKSRLYKRVGDSEIVTLTNNDLQREEVEEVDDLERG